MSLLSSSIRFTMHERRVAPRHITYVLNDVAVQNWLHTYLKSLFYFQETAIKWQIVLSTRRNRTLKDIWFRNKTWWLSELPLPEPLRSPISPCDFLCAYFPYHNRPWFFHACNVVCLKGKTSCPLSPFPSSIWWPCLPAHRQPHEISPGARCHGAPLLTLSGVHGVSCLYWEK